jgi:hypothetical protein
MTPKEEILDLAEKLTDWIDEAVHNVKSEEASAINNEGPEAQVDYLLGDNVDWPIEDLLARMRKAWEKENA